MAPPKASKAAHDDSKNDATTTTPSTAPASASATTKEKNGAHGSNSHHSNGKLRRVGSNNGTNAKESGGAGSAGPISAPAVVPDLVIQGLQWSAFNRDVLHAYRREHRLGTPTSFASSYHQIVLSQPGSIGLHSPTMARRKAHRRQSREQLALAVRKHFNSLGIQESDVIVDFIHKLKSDGAVKSGRKLDAGVQE